MADKLGNITIPEVLPARAFPDNLFEFPVTVKLSPKVAIHQFGSADLKIEQRYYLGSGARQWQISREVCEADFLTVLDLWNLNQGIYQPFTFNAPREDGAFESVLARFVNEPLVWNRSAARVALQITLEEVPTTFPTYTASSVTTVPIDSLSALASYLENQSQTCIPLLHIIPRQVYSPTNPYPDNIYLSDRRLDLNVRIPGLGASSASFLPRLLNWDGIQQVACGMPNISAESDAATFTLGNADHVFHQLTNDVQLDYAEVLFYVFHVETNTLIALWAGEVVPGGWVADTGPEFVLQCSDKLNSPFLIAPPRIVDRKCWKLFNGVECPFSTASTGSDLVNFPDVDPKLCDHGYNTPNGCMAHGMKRYFGGILALPQAVHIKDDATGFHGFGRTSITSVSLVSDSAYGQPLPIVVTNVPFPVPALIIEGRFESTFYEALGVVAEGPIEFVDQTSWQGSTLDGQFNHGLSASSERPLDGFYDGAGDDPAGDGVFMSLDQSGNQATNQNPANPNQIDSVFTGSSTLLDIYAAGTAFLSIRISQDPKTDIAQVVRLESHSMQAMVQTGWRKNVWSGPGVVIVGTDGKKPPLTNPVWLAINLMLRCRSLDLADLSVQEAEFDMDMALASSAICDLVVDKVVEQFEGQEIQFQFIGVIREQRALRDWIQDILTNCLGFYYFKFGRLVIGIRENAGAQVAYTIGNTLFRSLQITALGPKFTKLTGNFTDSEYNWVPNSASDQDDDYAKELGKGTRALHMPSQMNFSGIVNISQAQRVINTRLREEVGGVSADERKAARRVTWKTTLLGLDTAPGMVASHTSPDMPPYNPATYIPGDPAPGTVGYGKVRVERIKFMSDWSVEITGATVTDSMYDYVNGPKPADTTPGGVPPDTLPQPLRVKWHPFTEVAVAGNPLYSISDYTYSLGREDVAQTDGSLRPFLVVTGMFPVDTYIRNTIQPVILQASYAKTGGTLPGHGAAYWIALCGRNGPDGKFTPPSNIIVIQTKADDPDTILLALDKIYWPPNTLASPAVDSYTLFIGDTFQTIREQDEQPGLPTSLTFGAPLLDSTYNMPSYVYKFPTVKAKRAVHLGTIGMPISAVAAGEITVGGIAGYSDDWTGRVLSVLFRQFDSRSPRVDYTITAYAPGTGTFSVTPDPSLDNLAVGDVIVVRLQANIHSATTIGDVKIVNGVYPTGADIGGEIGYVVRIIKGTGAGQIRTISDNTHDTYTVDPPWTVPPDSTSMFIVETASWTYFADGTPTTASIDDLPTAIRMVADSLLNVPLLVAGLLVDINGTETPESLYRLREIYMLSLNMGAIPFSVRRVEFARFQIYDLFLSEDIITAIGGIKQVNFVAFAIDETDLLLQGRGTISDVAITFTPTLTQLSELGTVFEVGNYFVWNDENNYECCHLVDISPAGVWTIERAALGSIAVAHGDKTFYRLKRGYFQEPSRPDTFATSPGHLPSLFDYTFPNECIVAVGSQLIGESGVGPVTLVNLSPTGLAGEETPKTPGLRTCSGASDHLGAAGALSNGQNADFRLSVQTPRSLRVVHAYVGTAPTSGNCVVQVTYRDANGNVGILDTVTILSGHTESFPPTNRPEDRNGPYHADGLWTPSVYGALDFPPELLPSGMVDYVFYRPGGYVNFTVINASGAADLIVAIEA